MGGETLRVLTLNCWNISAPFEARLSLIRAGIQSLKPDLIGLQEIVVMSTSFDQGHEILDGLGYHRVFGPAFRWSDLDPLLPFDCEQEQTNAFGNLVASRWPIRRSEVRALPSIESGEARSILATTIDAPFGPLAFAATHLNWKLHHGYIRERQVVAVADFIEEWAAGSAFPPILVGDLNAEPDATEIRFLCGLTSLSGRSIYFQDAWRVAGHGGPGLTWDNANPYAAAQYETSRRIDYILVGEADRSGRGRIESARVVMNEPVDGVFPSDHFGVLAEIRC